VGSPAVTSLQALSWAPALGGSCRPTGRRRRERSGPVRAWRAYGARRPSVNREGPGPRGHGEAFELSDADVGGFIARSKEGRAAGNGRWAGTVSERPLTASWRERSEERRVGEERRRRWRVEPGCHSG